MMVGRANYREDGAITAVINGVEMVVPDVPSNRHRQIISEWEADGGEIKPYVRPLNEVIDDFRVAIQSHVDATAQSRRYDSGTSLASYVASSNPAWAAEAQAFVGWRDAVWAYAYAELDTVLAGTRVLPAIEEIIGELPVIEWPEAG